MVSCSIKACLVSIVDFLSAYVYVEKKNKKCLRLMTIIFWVQWEKNCRSLKNGASSSSEGSFVHLSGPSKDIHYKLNSVTTDRFEKNSDFSFKSSYSNSVVPLQCSTNESYQVSHPEVTRVANSAAVPLSVSTHRNMDFPGMNTMESTADHHTGENNHLYLFQSFQVIFS